MDSKKPWLSKMVWLGVATGVAPFIPGAAEWLADPSKVELVGMIWGALAILIRFVTKERVSLKD